MVCDRCAWKDRLGGCWVCYCCMGGSDAFGCFEEKDMKTCGDCKWWDKEKDDDGEKYKVCGRVEMEGCMSGADMVEKAYVCDGSAYYAALICREDFGCNLWEGN